MDIFTPGAGKASGAGTAQFSSQLQKILEVTTDALVTIDSKQAKKVRSLARHITMPSPHFSHYRTDDTNGLL